LYTGGGTYRKANGKWTKQ